MTYIIAEAGVNHNGDEKLAFALVDAAHKAGVDVVKFQTFKANKLVTEYAKQAEYQASNTGRSESQLAMLSRLELSYEAHKRLVAYCKDLGIEFLSTAFDSESLDFLVNNLKLTTLKIPSGELTNAPFVLAHAKTRCKLIVSTGMATLAEIEQALGVIAFGLINDVTVEPSPSAFESAYASKEGQQLLKQYVTILHCTTEYPAPVNEINLKAMNAIGSAFGLAVGYSDHTQGIVIPITAVALGAKIIEKHFTLDRNMEGPDHQASLEPDELSEMVSAIRKVEIAMGSGVKIPQESELKNKAIARKSLVASQNIGIGELFTSDNLAVKRPGDGMSPYKYWSLLGKSSQKKYSIGDLINE